MRGRGAEVRSPPPHGPILDYRPAPRPTRALLHTARVSTPSGGLHHVPTSGPAPAFIVGSMPSAPRLGVFLLASAALTDCSTSSPVIDPTLPPISAHTMTIPGRLDPRWQPAANTYLDVGGDPFAGFGADAGTVDLQPDGRLPPNWTNRPSRPWRSRTSGASVHPRARTTSTGPRSTT